ncbi:2-oxo-4-hydroxy-4-carboxy-5-ureidoimidazoline decarboxylase [Nakamurella endophytica]|uniref:2-oxo-4-hydroxy-4-carboxy-5-ureidoimidazoline decarboxylase n=1 Tax=Nakamurella endophytica TaxID=1748367 RepID=A0A917T4R9_9ACTN|nr:2-oxo-4-hydroxy-4-carboxy-5-ureidoimidazoline decarboxylase [Nakamurella endophytica]GGM11124.1 hypothetical protein GCM10011594_33850 [Nakamurella endophytica]
MDRVVQPGPSSAGRGDGVQGNGAAAVGAGAGADTGVGTTEAGTGGTADAVAAPVAVGWFDTAPAAPVTELLTACLDVPSWVTAVVAGRPYGSRAALLEAAAAAAERIDGAEVAAALARHPRIGESPASAGRTGLEAAWSAQEQATAQEHDGRHGDHGASADDGADQLRQGNRDYENRFGHIFLICATGLTRPQVLEALHRRLTHDDATEQLVVAQELRRIAAVRLAKAVAEEDGDGDRGSPDAVTRDRRAGTGHGR